MSNTANPSSSGKTADAEARLATWAGHPKFDEFRSDVIAEGVFTLELAASAGERANHELQMVRDENLEANKEIIIWSLTKIPLGTTKVATRKQGEAEQVIAWLEDYDRNGANVGGTAAAATKAASNSEVPSLDSHPPPPAVEPQALAAVIGYSAFPSPMDYSDEDSDEFIPAGIASLADSELGANEALSAVLPTPNDGGDGAGDAGRQEPDKKRFKFSLNKKGSGAGKRMKPPLPKAMAEAAAIADAEQDKLIQKAAAAAAAAVEGLGGSASQSTDGSLEPAPETDLPGPEAAGTTAARSRAGGSSTSRSATTPATPAVSNEVRRVSLSCSTPLLAKNGKRSGKKLHVALFNNSRLFRMRWDGGLVFVNVTIKDAAGGRKLPTVNLTQSPTALIIEALGARVRIASPPEAKNKEGFHAACYPAGLNKLSGLRDQLERLGQYIRQHAAGGQESLMQVDDLEEMRLILNQVGVIRDEEFSFEPALGGIWLRVSHDPPMGKNKVVWKTGIATPTVRVSVLMRRARLDHKGGLTVTEDEAYAASASAAAASAAAAAAAAPEVELTEEQERVEWLYQYARKHPKEYFDAVRQHERLERDIALATRQENLDATEEQAAKKEGSAFKHPDEYVDAVEDREPKEGSVAPPPQSEECADAVTREAQIDECVKEVVHVMVETVHELGEMGSI